MKKIISLLLILFLPIYVFSEYNPFLDIYNDYFPNTSSGSKTNILNAFVGDSIYFVIQDAKILGNIIQETPDTVWLKEKKPKRPKEGKDFLLCYNYKGIFEGTNFHAPASAFNRKIFKLLSVEDITEGEYYPRTTGYNLTISDLESGDELQVILDESLPSIWKLYSTKADTLIDSLIGNQFLKKDDYGTNISTYTFKRGDLYIKIEPIKFRNYVTLSPYGEFVLLSEKSEPLNLIYPSKYGTSYYQESVNFLTKKEYENELEKKRVYTINYELSKDTTLQEKLKVLPFKHILGKTNSYLNYVSQTIKPEYSPLGNHTIPNNTFIFIGDKITVRDKEYYKAALHGKAFYIECSKVDLYKPESLDTLLVQSQEVRDVFFEYAKILSRMDYLKERVDNLKEFQKIISKGFVVIDAHPYDMSEYTDGTGMTFSFLNTSNNTIKYITVNFIGYNAVDDPVPSGGKKLLTRRGIGPIEPFETASYDFEYVWFTDIVDYSKIRSILVQYKNGTTKTFTGKAVEIAPEEIINAPNYKSPVEEFLPEFKEDNGDNNE